MSPIDSALAEGCVDPTVNVTAAFQKYSSGSSPIAPVVGTSAILQCLTGFYWNDGIMIKNITCQLNLIWSKVAPCIRIFHFATDIKTFRPKF